MGLLDQTLPTIIGMGVVSQAVETVASRRKSASASPKRVARKGVKKKTVHRTFEGTRYTRFSRHSTRSGASYAADRLRSKGKPARVVAEPGGYWFGVYIRG
jgi:hypothetical protein